MMRGFTINISVIYDFLVDLLSLTGRCGAVAKENDREY